MQAQLKHATAAKHSVDEKLANALKVSERAYQSLVLADKRETELEEEIRRLKAWMQSSASSARDLDSAEKMSTEERTRFDGLLAKVRGQTGSLISAASVLTGIVIKVLNLEKDLTHAREQLRNIEELKQNLSKEISNHKAQSDAATELVGSSASWRISLPV